MASHAEGREKREIDVFGETYISAQREAMLLLINTNHFINELQMVNWYKENFAVIADHLAKNHPLSTLLTSGDTEGATKFIFNKCIEFISASPTTETLH